MASAALYQTITIGDIRISYIPDGYVLLDPTGVFPTTTLEDWRGYQQLLNDAQQIVGGIGAYLVQTANQTLLVDTAYGNRYYEGDILTLQGGKLLTNLRCAGLEPEEIDLVFFTHLHSDHVGGVSQSSAGEPALTFPNARFLTRRSEWQRFANPAESRWGVEEALAVLEKHIEWIEDGEQLFPGASILATPGHTSGHASPVISSGKERVIFLGDVFHSTAQIEHPEWTNVFDRDPELAKCTREQMLQELARPFTVGIASHFSPSNFGRVTLEQGRYQWHAIEDRSK